MSIRPNEIDDRRNAIGGFNVSAGVDTEGTMEDPTGAYPRAEYFNSTNINYAAVGSRRNDLTLFAASEGIDLSQPTTVPSQYPYNQVQETTSGHVIEIDDTPGNERILFKHNTGAGIEIRPDGSIVISTQNQKIEVVGGESKLIVEGDADIVYKGNVNFTVNGDFNLNVKGNFNTTVEGNQVETITGSNRKTINGNSGHTVNGTSSTTVLGYTNNTHLSGVSTSIKGASSTAVEGSAIYAASGPTTISSEDHMNISTPDINIVASNTSIIGATGTIGGQGVVMYGKGATFGEGVTAPTFHGDLDGLAKESSTTYSQQYADPDPGGGVGSDNWESAGTNVPTPTTATPTGSIITDYLTHAAGGVRRIKIDVGNYIRNFIDRTFNTGGVSNTPLNTARARSRLRDPANRSNQALIGDLMSSGAICSQYNTPTPRGIGRIIRGGVTPELGESPIGNTSSTNNVYQPTQIRLTIVPEYQYNPLYAGEITSRTRLAPGITMARFLGTDDSTNLNFIRDNTMRAQIAKYYYLHAQIIKSVQNDTDRFNQFNLVVSEGLYRPGPEEVVTPGSINDLRLKGKAVVYNLLNQAGQSVPTALFDLAAYLKSKIIYDRMVLSYDTIDCKLNARLIIVLPDIDDNWEGVYNNIVETELNGTKLSQGELVEVLGFESVSSFQGQSEFPAGTPTEWYSFKEGVDPRVSPVLLDIVEQIARRFGQPLVITDGFRPENANYGANTSQHKLGKAVDIRVSSFTQNETLRLIRIASELGITGIGVYSPKNILHLDIRDNKIAWGDDWNRRSVPSWAEYTIRQHLSA